MYSGRKNTLKNNHNHTFKQALKHKIKMYFVIICLSMKKKRGSVFFKKSIKIKNTCFFLFFFYFKNYQKINLFQVSSFILLIIYVSVPVVFYFILFFKIVIKHCLESRRHGGIFFIYIEPAPGQNECIGRFGVASNYRA